MELTDQARQEEGGGRGVTRSSCNRRAQRSEIQATHRCAPVRPREMSGVCDSGPATDIGVLMGKCMVPRYDSVPSRSVRRRWSWYTTWKSSG